MWYGTTASKLNQACSISAIYINLYSEQNELKKQLLEVDAMDWSLDVEEEDDGLPPLTLIGGMRLSN